MGKLHWGVGLGGAWHRPGCRLGVGPAVVSQGLGAIVRKEAGFMAGPSR